MTFLNSFSHALIQSIWQFLLIGLVAWVMVKLLPRQYATLRYNLLCLAYCLAPLVFCYTLFNDVLKLNSASFAQFSELAISEFNWLLWLWSLGFIWQILRLSHAAVLVHEYSHQSHFQLPPNIIPRVEELKAKFQLKREITIGTNNQVQSPSTAGFFKPIVLIPIACLTVLSTDELDAIIAHELAHIERSDFLHQWLQSAIECLFYYHPCIRFISEQIAIEREHACDDLVVSVTTNPKSLATGLLKVSLLRPTSASDHQRDHFSQLLQCATSNQVVEINRRIRRLVSINTTSANSKFNSRRILAGAQLSLLLLVGGVAGYSQPQAMIAADFSHSQLLEIKNQVCDQFKSIYLYQNTRYYQGGKANVRFIDEIVYIGNKPLPNSIHNKVKNVFIAHNLTDFSSINLEFYDDDVMLELNKTMPNQQSISKTFITQSTLSTQKS